MSAGSPVDRSTFLAVACGRKRDVRPLPSFERRAVVRGFTVNKARLNDLGGSSGAARLGNGARPFSCWRRLRLAVALLRNAGGRHHA